MASINETSIAAPLGTVRPPRDAPSSPAREGTAASAGVTGKDGNTVPPAESRRAEPGRLDGALNKVNTFVQNYHRQLSFSIHEETGITVVKVINTETEEVIRQIPPEEVLAIAEQIQAMQTEPEQDLGGLLFRERV